MNNLNGLTPASVWSYFESICQVPRPSKHEEKIIGFLMDFARKHNLPAKKDSVGNVLISKSASKGMESHRTLVLQSHLDMVCEKTPGPFTILILIRLSHTLMENGLQPKELH